MPKDNFQPEKSTDIDILADSSNARNPVPSVLKGCKLR